MRELFKTAKPITNYVDANNDKNKIKLIGLFTREGTVIDEGIYYKGIDAIKIWRRKMNAAYDMTLEIVGGSNVKDGIMVDILYTGDFPGSPVIVEHHFILENNLIAYLKIKGLMYPNGLLISIH
jgi:hypothetical protein